MREAVGIVDVVLAADFGELVEIGRDDHSQNPWNRDQDQSNLHEAFQLGEQQLQYEIEERHYHRLDERQRQRDWQ